MNVCVSAGFVKRVTGHGFTKPRASLRNRSTGAYSRGMTLIRREEHTVLEAREWAEGGQLFAILDACDTPSVVEKVKELGEARAVSLYRGTAEEEFESIAPYLVVVDTAVFDWITETLWAEPWGVFVRSAATLEQLRTHFRKFLLVEGPDGEEWYFRFYDPRVLATYLETCTERELGEFLGVVEGFGVVDPESYCIVTLARVPNASTPFRSDAADRASI